MSARYYIEWKYEDNAWERIDDFGKASETFAMLCEYKMAYHCGRFRGRYRGEIVYEESSPCV